MRIIILYDPKVCGGATLARHYMRHIYGEFQTADKDGKPYIAKDNCHIDFLNCRIDFISVNTDMRGRRAEIALIPEHLKNSHAIQSIVFPMMRTDFIAYYDQNLIK